MSTIGTRALHIAGATEELVNNVAYASALAGRLGEARDLLRDRAQDSTFLTATEGLVEILSGNTERGIALYDAAHKLAQEQKADPELPALVRLNQALALYRAGAVEGFELALPDGWEKNPSWVLFKQRAERACSPSVDG